MRLDNLKLKSFDSNRNAILASETRREEVFVSANVLLQAFITRAWLDRTLVNSAVGKCFLGAEVEQRGNRLEATKVWLSLEKNNSNEMFKNFGLELQKPELNPQKTGSKLFDISKMDEPISKLSTRFSPAENDLYNFRFDNNFLEKLTARHLKNANLLTQNNLVQADFTPDWRMVTGMGEASVYETNLTLHHVYGVPYIPASTIKGVLRHYLDELEESKKYIEQIFGNGDEKSKTGKPVRGQCIFFDAFPTRAPRIELDVMTPHYPKYYSEGQPPADWQSPTPIHFLTVGQGTPFRFLIGLPKGEVVGNLKSKLENWLNEALCDRGLGAKTAVGYGFWKNLGTCKN